MRALDKASGAPSRPLKRTALAKLEASVDGLELTAQDLEGGKKGKGGLITVGELLRRAGVDPLCDGCGRARRKCICQRDGKGLSKRGGFSNTKTRTAKPPCGKCGRTDYNDIRGRLCDRCAFGMKKAWAVIAKTKDSRGAGSDKHGVKNPFTDPEQDQRSRSNPFGDEHALDGNLAGQVAQTHQHAEEVKDAIDQAGGTARKLIVDAIMPGPKAHPHHKPIPVEKKAACEYKGHFPPSSAFKVAKQPEREDRGSAETRSKNASVTRSGTTGHIRIAQSHKLSEDQCRGYVHHLSRLFGVDAPIVRVKRGVGHLIRAYHTVGKTPSTSTIDISDGTLPVPNRVPRGNDYCTLTHEFAHHLFHARNPWLKQAVDDPHGPEFRRTFTEVASAAHRHARQHERGALAKISLADDTEYLTDIQASECGVGKDRRLRKVDIFNEGGAFGGGLNRANGIFAPKLPKVEAPRGPQVPSIAPKHVGPNPVGNFHIATMRNANALMAHVKNADQGSWTSRRAGMLQAANGAHVAAHGGLKNLALKGPPPPKLKALDPHPLRDIAAHADLMHQHAYNAFHAHQEGRLGQAASAWTLAHAHSKYIQAAVGKLGPTAPPAAAVAPKTTRPAKPAAKAPETGGDLPDVLSPKQALDLLGDSRKMPKGIRLKAADAVMHSSGRSVHNLLAKLFEAVCEGQGGAHPCHDPVVAHVDGRYLCRRHATVTTITKDWRERQAALSDDMKRRARRDFQRVLPEGKTHTPSGPRRETIVPRYPGPRGKGGLGIRYGDHVTERSAGTHAAVRAALDTIHEQRKQYGLPKLGFFSHGKYTATDGSGAGAVCWGHHSSQEKRYQNGGIHLDENTTHTDHAPHARPLTTENDTHPEAGMPDSSRRWWWALGHGEKGRKAKARTTALHEFGHHVDNYLSSVDPAPPLARSLHVKDGSWEQRLNHAHGTALGGHREHGARNLLINAKEGYPPDVGSSSDRDIGADGAHHGQCRLPSDYCHANAHEHFAEAWAAEHTGRGGSVHPAMRAVVHEAQGRLADMKANGQQARFNERHLNHLIADRAIGKALDILTGEGHHGQRAGKARRRAMDKPQGPTCAGMVPGGGISEEERIKRDLSYIAKGNEADGKCQADSVRGARSFYTPLPCSEQATQVASKRVAGKWRKWRVCEAHADELSSSHGFDADSINPDLRKEGDLDALIAKGRSKDMVCSNESCLKDGTWFVGARLLCDHDASEALEGHVCPSCGRKGGPCPEVRHGLACPPVK